MATVLLVDDEPDVRFMARIRLEDTGHEVHEARDGQDALDVLGDVGAVDVMLADQDMPRLSGVELRLALADRSSDLDVIVWSTRADPARDILEKDLTGLDLDALRRSLGGQMGATS